MQKIHKAKKSLGQNFLKSETALRKIVEAGEIKPSDIILEIGPGKGALTEKLLEHAGCVIAIEKDRDLFTILQEKFKNEISIGKLILIEDDILKCSTSSFFSSLRPSSSTKWDPRDQKKRRIYAPEQGILERTLGRSVDDGQRKFSAENFRGESEDTMLVGYKIIANIPYNITGAILKKFLTEQNQPSMMVLMVQNEVAKRIVARDGKESILSISIKAYGTPKLEMKVPARYFSPAPKVDSAIISIKNISRNFFTQSVQSSTLNTLNTTSQGLSSQVFEEKFWKIIHAGFAHKRKKLSNNLKNYIGKTYGETYGNKRAEDLTLSDWLLLTKSK